MEPARSYRRQLVRAVVFPTLLFGILSAVLFALVVHLLLEIDRRNQVGHLSSAASSRSWSILAVSSGTAIGLGVFLLFSSRRKLATLCATYETALAELQSGFDRQERENLNLLSEAMNYYAIFTLDTEGRITSWNADAERILGYRADDVLARRMTCFLSPEDGQVDRYDYDLDWASREGRMEDERWLMRKDGFRFKARFALVAIRDSDIGLIGYTTIVH